MSLENKEKRLREVSLAIDHFKHSLKSQGIIIELIPNAGEKIIYNYEIILDKVIRGYLKVGAKANIFKVVSGLELATVYSQPIIGNSPNKVRKFNALLAQTIAAHLLFNYKFGMLDTEIESNGEAAISLLENHVLWLEYIDTHDIFSFPTYANSLFWQSITVIMKKEFSEELAFE